MPDDLGNHFRRIPRRSQPTNYRVPEIVITDIRQAEKFERQPMCSVPVLSQEFHDAQLVVQLSGKAHAHLALSLVHELGELIDVCSTEFLTGLKIGRDSQNG
jgi:hypothetical protein